MCVCVCVCAQLLLACVTSYCLHMGLRTTAITLREELSEALPGTSITHLLQASKSEPLALWRWYRLARNALAEQGA